MKKLAAACLALAALVAGGCGSGSGSANGKTVVTFANWTAAEPATAPGIAAMIKKFEALHPKITIKSEPISFTGLVTTGVFVFMNSWNNLLYPLTLVNSNSRQTLPPGLLQSFSGTFKTDWGGMMAASVITSIPLIIAFFAVQRSMVRGLTAGALAGT